VQRYLGVWFERAEAAMTVSTPRWTSVDVAKDAIVRRHRDPVLRRLGAVSGRSSLFGR
jgi:hypothetical protein